MDIVVWLRSLGLGKYEAAFRENEIDETVLPSLTDEHLKELGVTALGHRVKLLDAIAALRSDKSSLAPSSDLKTTPSAPSAAPEDRAERRQVTVMFSDLVGSTALSVRMDPEDLREVISAYQNCVAETVQRFSGFVAKYMGDGVLVYFGYPQAYEDDAERAVRAGLELITAVAALKTHAPLQIRVGIATGMVVVGDLIGSGSAQERAVVGETPNLAARLEGLATPGSLVVADPTRHQLGQLFDLRDLGPQPLAGFTEPQRAWLVLGESGAVSRFEALRSAATPLVGRDEELDLLRRRWAQAKTSEGRVVLISGEPGIGKSRLATAVYEATEDEPRTRLRWFCSPHHQDSALHPIIVQLESAAGFARDDHGEAKQAKLRELLHGADADEFELIAELLSLPNAAADLNLSPQRKRERLFEALLNEMEALSRQRPILAMFRGCPLD
jgi:class 3 adenylate cyclase